MKTSVLTALVCGLAFAASAQAQAPASEIRESTDPARVADVEQRAADLQARQQAARMDMTSGNGSGSSGASGSGEGHKRDKPHSGHGSGHGAGHGSGHGSSRVQGGGSSGR